MTTKTNIRGAIALTVVVLALTVIGRYAGYGAGLLRPEVLLGFGVVATLIALIIAEYRVGSTRAATLQIARPAANVAAGIERKAVPHVRDDERMAA